MSDTATIQLVSVNGGLRDPLLHHNRRRASTASGPRTGSEILYTQGVFGAGDLALRDTNGNIQSVPSSWQSAEHFDGNADWATNFSPKCDPKLAQIGVNQFTTITLSCTDPDFGFGAEPPTPTPLESDALEIVMGPSHGTIGGLSDDGKVIYTPNKDFQGTDAFTYTGTDGTSEALPASVTIQVGQKSAAVDKTPPSISGIRRLGQEMAPRQRSGEDLESAGRDHDLLPPQRGGAGDAHLPATESRAQVGQELRQTDERQQESPEMHPLRQRRQHQRRRQGRPEQGALPGSSDQDPQTVARRL